MLNSILRTYIIESLSTAPKERELDQNDKNTSDSNNMMKFKRR
jgi:hypothetical protein